jgi:hypothetical protein
MDPGPSDAVDDARYERVRKAAQRWLAQADPAP